MPRVSVRNALAEKEERDGDICRTCRAPAEEGFEPHCRSCSLYWRDCAEGVFDDREAS